MRIIREMLPCRCSHPEHMMLFNRMDDEDDIYIEVHLSKKPFWTRVKYAISYIFGHQSNFGAFGEIHTDKEKILEVLKKM
jgi:hypothetical protein